MLVFDKGLSPYEAIDYMDRANVSKGNGRNVPPVDIQQGQAVGE